ncbi:ERAD-associated protein, partial [Oleoguttula sp. CCFEE 5521]
KKRTVWEWMEDFLQADAEMTALEQQEADDWDATHEHGSTSSGEEFWAEGEDIDDEVLVTLLLGGLIAVLAGLVWWRQREARRLAAQQAAQQGGQPPAEGQQQVVQGQQADGGFFPQPGEPGWNDWVAGGVGH